MLNSAQGLASAAKRILDTNQFMALGTADESGSPWVSPVYYACAGYHEFYWISSPDATHSRNIARRPQVSIVIFDSRQTPGSGIAVYMSASAHELSGSDLARGLEVYPGRSGPGVRRFTPDELQAPAPYRMYRALVSEHSMLCPRSPGTPCTPHGIKADHRTPVSM